MTDDTMRLLEIVQRSDDGDFLKTIAETALQRIMRHAARWWMTRP